MKIASKQNFISQTINKGLFKFHEVQRKDHWEPYFVDMRAIYSYPMLLRYVVDKMSLYLNTLSFDYICGVETASLPLVGALGYYNKYPTLYLRTKKKYTGFQNTVEGHFKRNESIVLIDDITVEAEASLKFVQAIENEGLVVKGIAVIYEKMNKSQGRNIFLKSGYDFFSIFTYVDLCKSLESHQGFMKNSRMIKKIRQFANK